MWLFNFFGDSELVHRIPPPADSALETAVAETVILNQARPGEVSLQPRILLAYLLSVCFQVVGSHTSQFRS